MPIDIHFSFGNLQSQHMRVPPSFGDLCGRPIRVLWYYAILCALLGGLPVIARVK